jgi:hypothetical protein
VLTPAPENNGGFGGVSSDAALAASFSPLFGKTLRHQLLTYPASAQTTIWCKKRASVWQEVIASELPVELLEIF